jgi:hypothetical protein
MIGAILSSHSSARFFLSKEKTMASLAAKFGINININYTGTPDIGSTGHVVHETLGMTLTDGTGANKGDVCFDDYRTLADGANETLDLHDGSLTDPLGTALTMDIMRGLYIKNTSTDASLLIGGAAATQLGLFADVSDILTLPPGGEFVFTAPDATGVDVTTNADLKLEHNGTGTSSMIYHIVVVGED